MSWKMLFLLVSLRTQTYEFLVRHRARGEGENVRESDWTGREDYDSMIKRGLDYSAHGAIPADTGISRLDVLCTLKKGNGVESYLSTGGGYEDTEFTSFEGSELIDIPFLHLGRIED